MSEAISLRFVSLWSIAGFNSGFQSFKKFQSFKPPSLFLPRDAGEDAEGLNDLNSLNVLNCAFYQGRLPIDTLS